MSARLQHIRILTDGRAGHENQSTGLALALQRRTGAVIETIPLDLTHSWLQRLRTARTLDRGKPPPQLLISAGHRTHLPMLAAARKFRARSIVIMKPSLPARWFDLCLVPRHDLGDTPRSPHVFSTNGALNKLPEDAPVKEARGLILIGGPSAHHGWSPAPLCEAIAEVVRASSHLEWTVGNSRRTPPGFLDDVKALDLPVQLAPWETTAHDWLPQTLMAALEAWITADSTSMISEALTARARTGILPLPAKRDDSRVVRAVENFAADGLVTPFTTWRQQGWPPHDAPRLHEAARCADEILARFFT
jgi:mitochondrial fission protein ELM1